MSIILYEKEFQEINECLQNLLMGSKAKCAFLVDKSGQLITCVGDTSDVDAVSLASLAAGNFAATSALAQLMGENEFSLLFHQGAKDNLHISVVESRIILVVIFTDKTSLGLIRLRVKNAIGVLSDIFLRIFDKVKKEKETTKLRINKPQENVPQEHKPYSENKSHDEGSSKSETSITNRDAESTINSKIDSEKKDSSLGEDFQKKASDEIDNLFMD